MNLSNTNKHIGSWKNIGWVAGFVLIILLLNCYVFKIAFVSGNSMYPTLHSGDVLLINQINYSPAHNDLILIKIKPNKYIIKRIIAVGGEIVKIDYEDNKVYVNEELLTESYINVEQEDPMIDKEKINPSVYEVPYGYVFVMGDNRNLSTDSRSSLVGMIKNSNIVGKVILHFSHDGFVYSY